MKNILVLFLISSLFTSCSSMKKSLITGVSIGAVGGALIGNTDGTGKARGKHTRNGLMIGALLGAGISYLAHKDKKKKDFKLQQKSLKSADETPLLTQPKVKRVWVEDKVQGKRFIKGHWEYIIEEQSVWSQQ